MKKHLLSFLVLSTVMSVSAFANPPSRGGIVRRPLERPVVVEERPAGSSSSSLPATRGTTATERATARGESLTPSTSGNAARGNNGAITRERARSASPEVPADMLAPLPAAPAGHTGGLTAPRTTSRPASATARRTSGGNELYNAEVGARVLSAEAAEVQSIAMQRYGQGPYNDVSCLDTANNADSWKNPAAIENVKHSVGDSLELARNSGTTKAQLARSIIENGARLTGKSIEAAANGADVLSKRPCNVYNRRFFQQAIREISHR